MTRLSERLPMVPSLHCFSRKAQDMVRPYLGWQLLEVDTEASEILICKRCDNYAQYSKAKNLLILTGRLARVWLKTQEVAYS